MFAMAIYTLILAGSALLAGWLGVRLFDRIGGELGLSPQYAQLPLTLSALAFLTVVSMPAGVMIAALVVAILGMAIRPEWTLATKSLFLPLAAAVILATLGIWESPGTWPSLLPLPAALAMAALIFAGLLETSRRAQPTLLGLGAVITFTLIPLLAAPLLFESAHSSLALDGAILLCALLGGMLLLPEETAAAPMLRLPTALVVGYSAIQAIHYGAWPLGIAAALIFAGGILFAPRAP